MSRKREKTVTTTIDGREYIFPQGQTILEAAASVGIEIPHYCYHPGLSIAGACRMCLVEIEEMPKLQIACHTTVSDGIVVFTDNERVKKARRAILEFHFVNHPLDCPVCDQAGECGLQNYYMTYGLYLSRVREDKVKKTRKAARLGPHIMLDQERCILCSRCVRFCNEITRTCELGIFSRGDRSELDVFPGTALDNPYAANVVDICPVGALTDREFRFKTRVWYLEEAESVCPHCSNGCNIYIHYNLKRPYKNSGRRISRLKPRENLEVNDWWICDEGRYCFDYVDREDRLTAPLLKAGDRGPAAAAGWDEVLVQAAEGLRTAAAATKGDIAVLVSPQAANEELYLIKKIFSEQLPGCRFFFSAATHSEPTEDSLLRKKDKNPNTRGAELLWLTPGSKGVAGLDKLRAAVEKGAIGALYICYLDIAGLPEEIAGKGWGQVLELIPLTVYHGANSSATTEKAHMVFPAAAFAEREGTVTNFASRVQIQRRAFAPLGQALPGWKIVQKLGNALGGDYKYLSAPEVFDNLALECKAFRGLSYEKIGSTGITAGKG